MRKGISKLLGITMFLVIIFILVLLLFTMANGQVLGFAGQGNQSINGSLSGVFQ